MVESDEPSNPNILHLPWDLVFLQYGLGVSEFATQSCKWSQYRFSAVSTGPMCDVKV
jgi:hypothetical protein